MDDSVMSHSKEKHSLWPLSLISCCSNIERLISLKKLID